MPSGPSISCEKEPGGMPSGLMSCDDPKYQEKRKQFLKDNPE
jgi:hypothetical protein